HHLAWFQRVKRAQDGGLADALADAACVEVERVFILDRIFTGDHGVGCLVGKASILRCGPAPALDPDQKTPDGRAPSPSRCR
ncbi:MAG TPA: hypothetical protein VFR30_06720, partial [Lysobacter sp.]|nr:hypothetical protein [Lysobacter sp.]